MTRVLKGILAALVLAGLAGCTTLGPDYQRPEVDTPDAWNTRLDGAGRQTDLAWWKEFGDPVLEQLIQTALENNRDVRIAAARIREYAARVDIARSGFYPNLGYGASAARLQSSRNTLSGPPDGASRVGSDFQTGLSVGWELDFWGKIQRASEAARADLLAQEQGRRALLLSLVSSVATAYIDLLSLDRQLQITRDTLERRAETVELFRTQLEGGVVSELEVAQARAEYETTALLIPIIEQQVRITEFNLSVLLGRNPGPIVRDASIDRLQLPRVPADIPSQVLLQRPDILQAEQNLVSANALIGVARAAYFPSISLTGLLGLASAELSSLLDGASGIWSAGAGLVGPIFAGGALDARLRGTEAVQEQLLQSYLLTVQRAFADVEKALVTAQKLGEVLEASERQVQAYRDSVNFSRQRYDEGYVSYLEVLDSERKLFDAELEYTKRQGNAYAARVAIYKAMGGGWVNTAAAVADQVDFPPPDPEQERPWWDFPPATRPGAELH